MTVVFCRLAQFQAIFVAIAVADAVQRGQCWDPRWPSSGPIPMPPGDRPPWPQVFRAEAEWVWGDRADPPLLTTDTLGLIGVMPSLLRYLDEPDQAQAMLAQRAAVSGCDPLPAQGAYERLRSHLIPATTVSAMTVSVMTVSAMTSVPPAPTATWARAEALLQTTQADFTLAFPLALQPINGGGGPDLGGPSNGDQAALLPLVALGCAARGGLRAVPVPWRLRLAEGDAEALALATALWRRWAGLITAPDAETVPAIAEIPL